MPTIEREIQVSFRHQIHFTEGVFEASNPLLRDLMEAGESHGSPKRALVIIDENVAKFSSGIVDSIRGYFDAFGTDIALACTPLVIEGGERTKNSYFHVSEIQSAADRFHVDRHNYIIAMGGGALLDMVGLAATTTHRGVRHIRIPTTTLSQNDSGVGVKNGINAFGKKNFIGTFAPPYAVVNDFQLLRSLPDREKRNGYSEAVKVALIRDQEFFEWIESEADALREFEPNAMRRLIFRCAELHVNHIASAGDPFEFGSARPLDFGHWAAHKLEQLSDYQIRHGEAVAIGIALDTLYSRNVGMLDAVSAERTVSLLERLGFEIFSDALLRRDEQGRLAAIGGLEEFREHLGGRLTITLLEGIGKGVETHEMDETKIIEALFALQKRAEVARDGRQLA